MVLPPGMYWHIFRKDWRLLSTLAITSAGLQGLLGFVTFHSEPYPLPERVSALGALVTFALLCTMSLLIILTVQQEALPGVSQDWLVRPVKRRDLLLAKLLSIAVFVHGPIVIVDLLSGLAEGFSSAQVLRATLLGNLEIALIFSLPVMAAAALTRSIGEFVLGALAVLVVLLLARLLYSSVVFSFTHKFHLAGPVSGTGIQWVWRFVSHVVLLVTVSATVTIQYFRRDTLRARGVFAGGLFLFMMAQDLPWAPAFAIQQGLAANPQAGNSVSVVFEPGAQQSPAASLLSEEDSDGNKDRSKTLTQLVLPVRISGLPGSTMLHVDRGVVRFVGVDGRTLYRGEARSIDVPSALTVKGSAVVGQPIELPTSIYRKVAHQPLRVELQYSFTLLRSRMLPPLAALDDHRRDSDLGRCATRINGSAVEVGCRKAGETPFCVSMALEQGARRNPEKFICELNYEPRILQFSVEPIDHLHAKLPFRDSTGVAHFPIDEFGLRGAHVMLNVYEPEDHFSRRITLEQWQLSERHEARP